MQHVDITTINNYTCKFSVCTLVTDFPEYEEMKTSFVQNGFEQAEFLIADNSNGNKFDAYKAIRRFFNVAKGRYILLCHQDIIIKDNVTKLEKCLQELDEKHPNWAIAGNAGGKHIKGVVKNLINHDDSVSIAEGLPVRVYSVDENFMVIDREKFSSVSANLEGFHFYGTDLCLLADIQGYGCYVIDFMLQHKSAGNFNEHFYRQKTLFIEKYAEALRSRFIESTCARLFFSGNKTLRYLLNTNFAFFWVKVKYKLKNKGVK